MTEKDIKAKAEQLAKAGLKIHDIAQLKLHPQAVVKMTLGKRQSSDEQSVARAREGL